MAATDIHFSWWGTAQIPGSVTETVNEIEGMTAGQTVSNALQEDGGATTVSLQTTVALLADGNSASGRNAGDNALIQAINTRVVILMVAQPHLVIHSLSTFRRRGLA